jgi:hypothetical protein
VKYRLEIYLIGAALAFGLSLKDSNGLDWALIHSLLSWVYVLFTAIF